VGECSQGLIVVYLHKAHSFLRWSQLMFDTAIACRGSMAAGEGVGMTTLEQSNLRGPVTVAQAGVQAPAILGDAERHFDLSSGDVWVHHRHIGYLLPRQPGRLTVSATTKLGSWWDISNDANSGQTPLPNNGSVSLPVFDAFVEHSVGYSYTVVPNVAAAEMPYLSEITGGLTISGAKGGSRYHAAANESEGLLVVVAWDDAAAVVLAGWVVTPSRASMFVLRGWSNGTVHASASVPDSGGALQLVVTSAPHWASHTEQQQCTLHFTLPMGTDDLGRSTVATCEPGPAPPPPPPSPPPPGLSALCSLAQ
jgi:hypothetical protein